MAEQDQTRAQTRETLSILKINMDAETPTPEALVVSDKVTDDKGNVLSHHHIDVPLWLGGWSLHNMPPASIMGETGIVSRPTKRKKVAIIGSQREYVPEPMLNSDEWEVWGCNSLWRHARDSRDRFRADRWFELHPLSVQTEDELRRMRECPIPIYVLEWTGQEQAMRAAVRYPIEQVMRLWPIGYFTCTFAYEIALALLEGFEEIGLFGCELSYGSPRERTFERACVEFWIGLAAGLRRKIHLPPRTTLCKHPYLYGYDYASEAGYCEAKLTLLNHFSKDAITHYWDPKEEATREQAEYEGRA